VQANIKPGLVSKAAAISASRFKKRDPIRFERISTPSLNWCGRASYAVLGQSQEFAGSRQPTADSRQPTADSRQLFFHNNFSRQIYSKYVESDHRASCIRSWSGKIKKARLDRRRRGARGWRRRARGERG
jgi:hypothetical protein